MKSSTKYGLMASAYFAVAVDSGVSFLYQRELTRKVMDLNPTQTGLLDLEDKLRGVQQERAEAIPFRKTEEDKVYLGKLREEEFSLHREQSLMLHENPELENLLLEYQLTKLGIAVGYALLGFASLRKVLHHSVDARDAYLRETKPL